MSAVLLYTASCGLDISYALCAHDLLHALRLLQHCFFLILQATYIYLLLELLSWLDNDVNRYHIDVGLDTCRYECVTYRLGLGTQAIGGCFQTTKASRLFRVYHKIIIAAKYAGFITHVLVLSTRFFELQK